MLKQVGRHDLEIVIGSVGEGAPAVAVAERPNSFRTRPQLIIHPDITAPVRLHSRFFKAKIIGVWSPPYSEQDMGAKFFRLS